MMRRQAGLSQIELLIVLAIIVILALILLPVLSRARENARQSSCVANVHQILSAISIYAQDHDGQFFNDPVAQSWSTQLATDSASTIFSCPKRGHFGNAAHPDYGFNAAFFGQTVNSIVEPDSAVLVTDLRATVTQRNYALIDPDRDIVPRHNAGVTVGFVDGHVGHVTLIGQDIYEQCVVLGLHFTVDNSPLPWKVVAMGSGDTVNLSGRGSQGYFVLNGQGEFPAQRPAYVAAWDMSAFGKRAQNAASGWNYAGADEGCSACLICRDKHIYVGGAWTAQGKKDIYKMTLTPVKGDTATHLLTVWTPWCHPNLNPRDEQVAIKGTGNRQVSFSLCDLRYTRGAYVTFSFTGPITIILSNMPPTGESSTLSFGALLFD